MGDKSRSPFASRSQKQAKHNAEDQKKRQETAAKQVSFKR
jgi:hypothetical protein